MKAKVIIVQATAETAEILYGLVKKMVDTTAVSYTHLTLPTTSRV